MEKTKQIYYCPQCQVWRGDKKECPECKSQTIPSELPFKRGGYYFIPGIERPLPSVTEILSVIAKPALIYWAAKTAAKNALENPFLSLEEAISSIYKRKTEAADKGKDVHKVIANLLQGNEIQVSNPTAPYLKAFQKFKKTIPCRLLLSEKVVYSKKYGYAGTLDFLTKFRDNTLWILDFKTGKNIYPQESALQLIAYKEALEEMYPKNKKVDKLGVIHLKPDGTFSLNEVFAPFEIFLAAKQLFDWQQFFEK